MSTEPLQDKEVVFSGFDNYDNKDFRDHISTSIPSYKEMVEMIIGYSQYFSIGGGKLIDVGCSDGGVTELLSSANPNNHVVGLEPEHNFFKDLTSTESITYLKQGAEDFDYRNSSLVIMLFTLQFIPYNLRVEILKNIYNGLDDGGGFIFSEKTLAEDSLIEDMQRSLYYDFKHKSFDSVNILSKERNLRHIMKINTMNETLTLLNQLGYKKVEVIWKSYGFCSYVCIK
jgi:tRNA (cmo5U34)-methyltransferase